MIKNDDEYYALLDRIERLAIQDPPELSAEGRQMQWMIEEAREYEAQQRTAGVRL